MCDCDYGYKSNGPGTSCVKMSDEESCLVEHNGVWLDDIKACITDPQDMCQLQGGLWIYETASCSYEGGECEHAGGSWNELEQKCTSLEEVECQTTGGTWDDINYTCERNCQEGYEKDANGNCVEVPCPSGYERNANGECEQVSCPEGYQRNVDGECVPKIPVVQPPLPPVTWGSRTYNDPATQKNYYSEEKRCEGIQDMWNNAVDNTKEVFAFLLEDGTLVTIPFQGNTSKNADVPRESYIEPTAGFYLNGEGSGSYEKIVATIHTHNECVNDGTNGVSGISEDDIKVHNAFSQFSPAITHYVLGCGVLGETDANGNINNKQWGPLYQTCWNIK